MKHTLKELIDDPNITLEEVKDFIRHLPISVQMFNQDTEIAEVWSIKDVQSEAEALGLTLTDSDAFDVLQAVESNFDASVGITWDVIRFNLETYLNQTEGDEE